MKDKEYEAWLAKQGTRDQASDTPVKESAAATRSAPAKADVVTPPRDPLANVFGGAAGIEMADGSMAPPEQAPIEGHIEGHAEGPDAEAVAAHKAASEKKGEAVWYVVVGVAMLFMASFHWGVGAGGVLMVMYGSFRYVKWGRIASAAYDPWQDDDIDAWEKEEMDAEA